MGVGGIEVPFGLRGRKNAAGVLMQSMAIGQVLLLPNQVTWPVGDSFCSSALGRLHCQPCVWEWGGETADGQ